MSNDLLHERGPFKFKLAEEFRKGAHYYDLPELPSQLRDAPHVDLKTSKPVALEPEVSRELYRKYVGVYQFPSGKLIDVRMQGDRLFEKCDAIYSCELLPLSRTRFVLPCLNAALEFTAAGVTLQLDEWEGTAERMR